MSTVAPVPLWNLANILTMVRVLLVPVFVVFFLGDSTASRIIATAVFIIAAITDRLDGQIARSRGLVTNFGKIADPIADKALVISALVLLSLDGLVPWWVTVVIIVRELGITVLRFVMIRRSVIAASSGGKLKTVLQLAFIISYLVPWAALLPGGVADVILTITWWIMIIAVAVTVLTGLDYIVRAARFSEGPADRASA
ncbi:CDP-diacylglycerol--glycerol-3-phosphate 3-phosphatidyltransferase [Georgenia sunbinii]|uniref:CDP-diacylglycerol--glycerol-3-phosphate 3-phosphatidyltransferase n=1 Tax=Georgenia sunbinii TaxID=3117728 RepID=UPI002F268AF9